MKTSQNLGEGERSVPDDGGRFVKDVLTVIGGTTVAQVVGILVYPVITRLFSPDAFGVSAVFVSLTTILSVLACLRYEAAVMLPKDDRESAAIVWLCAALTLTLALALTAFVIFAPRTAESLMGGTPLGALRILIPFGVGINGVILFSGSWVTRRRAFSTYSFANMVRSISTAAIQIAGGFGGLLSGGILILAVLVGNGLQGTVLLFRTYRRDRSILVSGLDLSLMIKGAKRYRNFPFYDSFSALVTNIAGQLPVLVMARYFSAAIVGNYSLSLTILLMPLSLIGSAISQVFFQKASEIKNDQTDRIDRVVESTVKKLILIGILPIVMLILIGQELFVFVFGPQWSEAGLFAQILAPYIFLQFVASPISSLFSVFEKQKFTLVFNIIVLVIRTAALVVGGLSANPLVAMSLYSGACVFTYGYALFWLLRISSVHIWRIIHETIRYLIFATPTIVVVLVLESVLQNPVPIIACSAIACVPFFVIVWRAEPWIKPLLLSFFGRSTDR